MSNSYEFFFISYIVRVVDNDYLFHPPFSFQHGTKKKQFKIYDENVGYGVILVLQMTLKYHLFN